MTGAPAAAAFRSGPARLWCQLALAALCLAATAWMRPLTLPDEGRYVGVAWDMVSRGDGLTPVLDGLPYFHKPPLFYWITAAALSLFGPHEWPARAAPWLGALLATASVFLFAYRWCGARVARLGLLAMLTQPLILVGGQFANMDMLVAGLITAATLAGADAILRLDAGLPWRRSVLAAHALAGLGVLAKGLIGVVIPALTLLSALLLTRRQRWVPRLLWLPAVLVLAAVVVPWFWLMDRQHPGFLHYVVVEQHLNRYLGSGFNNVQPAWFFPAILALVALPWWPWVITGLWRAHAAPGAPATFIRVLMVVWGVAVTVFFSIPQSKLLGYILPAVAPLALLAACGYAARDQPGALQRVAWWSGQAVLVVASLSVVVVLTLRPTSSSRTLGHWLAQQPVREGSVWLLDRYDFDLMFYARLRSPLRVVGDWTDPDYARHDNWRKELADAGRFAPDRAAQILVTRAGFLRAACAGQVDWVVASPETARTWGLLLQAPPVFTAAPQARAAAVWRLDPGRLASAGLDCPQTPTPGSAGR